MRAIISRLRPRLGPGLAIALILAGVILWQSWRWQNSPKPLIVEHQTVTDTGLSGVPDPPFVLERADELRLSADQRRRIGQIGKEFLREEGPLVAQADEARDAAARKLQEMHEAGKRAAVDETSEWAQSVQVTSGRLAEARLGAWPKLQAVLSQEQARQAKAAWAEAHTLRLPKAKQIKDRG